ncbi:MAG: hypothetical protein WBA39_09035 [Rivularia sp. (in: cyanobacteria)]
MKKLNAQILWCRWRQINLTSYTMLNKLKETRFLARCEKIMLSQKETGNKDTDARCEINFTYFLHQFQQPPWNKFPGSKTKSSKDD